MERCVATLRPPRQGQFAARQLAHHELRGVNNIVLFRKHSGLPLSHLFSFLQGKLRRL
jgi:hypothetical protein